MDKYHHFHLWLDANTPAHYRIPNEVKIMVPYKLRQYNLDIPKKFWRPDYCWPDHMLIVEIEGGIFKNIKNKAKLPDIILKQIPDELIPYDTGPGGHNRGAGYRRDLIKYNWFIELGYTVYRFIPEMLPLQSCYAINIIEQFFRMLK